MRLDAVAVQLTSCTHSSPVGGLSTRGRIDHLDETGLRRPAAGLFARTGSALWRYRSKASTTFRKPDLGQVENVYLDFVKIIEAVKEA